jgi:phenylacetate-coenzyme A ligase PaaK-like adenylate-forming protein
MLSFSSFPLKPEVYSKSSFQILGAEQRNAFLLLTEIILLETGDPQARRSWQSAQLHNVLQHAASRSPFWRERIGRERLGNERSDIELSRLPVLTRADLNRQFATEGALLNEKKDGVKVKEHMTSGSTGAPARFFYSHSNGVYHEARSFAQFLMEGMDLRLNRCRVRFAPGKPGFSLKEWSSYASIFSGLFSTGKNADLTYFDADLKVVAERMRAYRPHYLICLPQFIETMLHNVGPQVFKQADVRMFMTYGNEVVPEVRAMAAELGIAARSNYSCEEIGLIGVECPENPDTYHVAESNVLVDLGEDRIEHQGAVCGNVLLTGLHCYATPFIRYQVGDFARLAEQCRCGHRGLTIDKLLGRLSTTLKLPDGGRRPFHLAALRLKEVIDYQDLKVRQTAIDAITVELVSKDRSDEARHRLTDYLQAISGPEFSIHVESRDRIDWGSSPKRLMFLCEV